MIAQYKLEHAGGGRWVLLTPNLEHLAGDPARCGKWVRIWEGVDVDQALSRVKVLLMTEIASGGEKFIVTVDSGGDSS